MTKIKRLAAIVLAFLMIFSSVSVAASAWDPKVDDSNKVNVRTEILRKEADNDLVVTKKVKQGETVKVRVYAETEYFTSAGSMLFFYSSDFFESAVINPSVGAYYSKLPIGMSATFSTEATSVKEKLLVMLGVIDQAFADENNFVLIDYSLDSNSKNIKLNKEEVLFEMDLTVKADAPADDIGKFFIKDTTILSQAQQNGVFNIPKGPNGGYNETCVAMNNWTPEFTYTDSEVELYDNFVTVTFDAAEGYFEKLDAQGNSRAKEIIEGEANETLSIAAPKKTNNEFIGWLAPGATTVTDVTAFPSADTTYTASWKSTVATDKTLKFKTEFYRFDGTEWVKTQRVKPGEQVQLRLFVDTSYYTNAGEIILFYDNSFFLNPTGVVEDSANVLTFNDDPASSAKLAGASGEYMLVSDKNFTITDLVENGCITNEFVKTHGAYTIKYHFNPTTGKVLSGDQWFASIPMIVSPSATGEGDCYIVEDTLLSPTNAGYINIPISGEGLGDEKSQGLWLWEVALETESYPVSLESNITFDANGGGFAEGDPNTFVITDTIGNKVDATAVPAISKAGATFLGWAIEGTTDIVEIPAEMPHEDLKLVAQWISKVEITFEPNNGDSAYEVIATPFEAFVAPETPSLEGNRFVGWTSDASLKTVTGLPDVYPETATTYYAVFEGKTYTVSYYVLNDATGKPELANKAQNVYGAEIIGTPSRYEIPTGYELSSAYTDLTLTKPFVEGTTMPAKDISLYYTLKAKTYNAEFNPNGGYFDGDETATASKLVPTTYEAEILIPAAPEREGYTFKSWSPTPSIMDAEGKVYTAVWEADVYTAEYYVDGNLYEAFNVGYEESLDVPQDPKKLGYTFVGWVATSISNPTADDVIPAEELSKETMPMNDVSYKAVFAVDTYNATFTLNGGNIEGKTDDVIVPTVYGETIALPAAPVKEGYTFTGWVDENNNAPSTMPAEDAIYTATWNVNKYTLVYVADGKELYNGEVEFGSLVAANEPAEADVAKEGYEFTGWAGTPAFSETATMPATTVTYYATYKVETYNAVFNAGEGTFAEAGADGDNKTETVPTDFGSAINVPEIIAPEGYVFDGWVDADGNKITVPNVMPAEGLEFNAAFAPAKNTAYQIKVNTQNTNGTYTELVFDKTGTTGETAEFTPAPETGFHVSTVETNVLSAEIAADGSTVLVVYYDRDKIAISFNANNGNDADNTSTEYLYGSIIAVPTVTYTGYIFEGWTLADDTTETVVVVQTLAEAPAEYVAKWTAETHTVTYLAEGVEVAKDTFAFGEEITKNAFVPTKTGYTFADIWYVTDPNTAYVFGAEMGTEDIVLNAKFTPNPYDAVFYAETTSTEAHATVPTNFDTAIKAPATPPTKTGYRFDGWSTNGVDKLTSLGNMDTTEGKKFYAIWAPDYVDYKVEHYMMNTEGNYNNVVPQVENLIALTGDKVTATIKTATGFIQDEAASLGTVTEAIVAADGSTVLKVYYERLAYKLTINMNDQADGTANNKVIEYYYGESISASDPEYTGHIFTGWIDANGAATVIPGVMPNNDVFVEATWSLASYRVTYMNGETEVDFDFSNFSEEVYKTSVVPSNPGYKLVGWVDANGKTPADYASMPANSLVFQAQWEIRTDMIYITEVYVMGTDGKYPETATETNTHNDGVTFETVTFDYDVPAGFTLDTEDVVTPEKSNVSGVIPATGIITLVAYVARNQHVVETTVDGNVTNEKTYYFGEDIATIADPEKTGYTFLGWYDADGKKVDLLNPGKMDDADIIVEAKFDINSYNAVFNAGEGAIFPNGNASQTVPVDYNSAITAPDTNPSKTGYKFEGWSTDGVNKLDDLGIIGTADVMFVPVWSKISYTVTYYVLNPETMANEAVDTLAVPYDEAIAGTPAKYTVPEGYTMSAAYTDAAFTSAFAEGTKMPANDVSLYFKLTANKYTITFDEDGGSAVADIEAAYKATVAKPADPTKTGYEFLGWYEGNSATAYEFSTMPLNGTALKAKWEAIEYTVTFDEAGGTLVNDIVAKYDETITAPTTTRTGYKFLGWFEIGSDKAYTFSKMPAANVQLQAKWEVIAYNATFNAGEDAIFPNDDDADKTSETVSVNFGDNITLPEAPVKEGYTFTGWVDGEGKAPEKMPASDATYTATWSINKYTLVYVADGKELYKGEVEFGSLVAANEPAEADVAKEGYEFTGWAGTPAFSETATMPATTVTYYATYKVETYDAVFNAGEGTFVDAGADGDNKTETVSTNFGEAIDVPELNDREGYDFAGWKDAEGNVVSIPDVMPAAGLDFTAYWTPAKDTSYIVKVYTQGTDTNYPEPAVLNRTGTTDSTVTADQNPPEGFHVDTEKSVLSATVAADGSTVLEVYYARNAVKITFNGAGGTMNDGTADQYIIEQNYIYGQTVVPPVPVRTGYEFTGWDKSVVLIANEDAEYKATWDELPFTVTYMADGVEVDKNTFDYGTNVIKTEIVPAKTGFKFVYWYETDENVEFTFGNAMPAKNIVLNAKFTEDSFKSKYYSELDSTVIFTEDSVVYGQDIPVPANKPMKSGYSFEGWSTDGTTVLETLGKMDTEGKTFYAVWKANDVDYTIEYYLMKVDGSYEPFANDFETAKAPTDSTINATAKDIEHFTFDKENANNILSATVAANGTTVLKLYYVRNQYTLTVNKNNGTDVESNTYYYEQKVPAVTGLNNYTGYTFSHWENADKEVTTYPTSLTKDMSLKAVWNANEHTVYYNIVEKDDNGNVLSTEEHGKKTQKFGEPLYVPGNPVKIGYAFGGWVDANGKQPSDYGTMPDSDLVFEAVWAPDENVGYILNIYEMDVNGQYPADPTTVLTFNDGVVGEERAPGIKVPAGFTLDNETDLTPEKSNTSGTIPAPALGKLVLNAYFQRNLWTLTTVVNGESTPVQYYFEAPVSVADPVVAGSKFLGWFDSADYTTAVTVDPTMPDNNVTIYAKMEVQSYNVTFNAGEGLLSNGQATTTAKLAFGTEIEAPATAPVLDGYTFGGWALSTAPDVKVENFGTVGEADVEYVAIWTKTAYSVVFYDYSNERGPAVSTEKYMYKEETNLNMGSVIPFPEDPAIVNYEFIGWSKTENDKVNLIAPGATMPAEDLVLYAVYERVKVMLIPEPTVADCTTVIDRAGGTVDDYVDGTSQWYIYGLKVDLTKTVLDEKYIDVSGDGRLEIVILNENYNNRAGTGTIINVYDNVDGTLVESFRIIIFGDLNGDARVDSTDDSMISDEIMGTTSWSYERSPEYIHYVKKAANLTAITNGDNRVDVTDGSCINAHVLGSARIVQTDGSMRYA